MEDSIDVLKKLQEDNMKLLRELLSCQETLKRKSQKWIKVSERFPQKFQPVIIAINNGFIGEGYLNNGNEWFRNNTSMSITQMDILAEVIAWMPMPKYEEGKE